MRIVGLTGGIGSGKSTVSALWKGRGTLVIDADEIAREVVLPGRRAYRNIVKAFGPEVLSEKGNGNSPLDREALGRVVFSDDQKRRALNAITHPAIFLEILSRLALAFLRCTPVVVLDVPLLFEAAGGLLAKLCTLKVVVVLDSVELQVERMLMRTPELSEEDARRRIDAQFPTEKKVRLSQVVIDNSGSREQLAQKTSDFYDRFLNPSLALRVSAFFWWAVLIPLPIVLALAMFCWK